MVFGSAHHDVETGFQGGGPYVGDDPLDLAKIDVIFTAYKPKRWRIACAVDLRGIVHMAGGRCERIEASAYVGENRAFGERNLICLLYTSPSPRDS